MSARARFVAWVSARAAFGLAMLAASAGRLPVVAYLPTERRFTLEPPRGPLAMMWFGAVFDGLAFAAVAFAVAWVVASRRGLPARVVTAIARAGALALLVDFAYFGWKMAHQDIHPGPVPCDDQRPASPPRVTSRGPFARDMTIS